MNEMQTYQPGAAAVARTPETLGAEVRNLTNAARYITVYYAIEIGRRLTEAKELVAHGEWMDWLKNETELSQSAANRLMRIYAEYGQKMGLGIAPDANSSMLNNLSVSNALRLLAVPEEERESFAETVDAEHLSTRELEEAIRERDEAIKREKEALARENDTKLNLQMTESRLENALKEARDATMAARKQNEEFSLIENEYIEKISELEKRPIEVAVQEPDPAEIERRAVEIAKEAREKDAARIAELERAVEDAGPYKARAEEAEAKVKAAEEKAKAERDKLKEKLKAAEEKLAGAGAEDKAAADKLRGEVEALKKQIAMSGEVMVKFRIHFAAWQQEYQALISAMMELPEEQLEKCRAAIRAQAEKWSAQG